MIVRIDEGLFGGGMKAVPGCGISPVQGLDAFAFVQQVQQLIFSHAEKVAVEGADGQQGVPFFPDLQEDLLDGFFGVVFGPAAKGMQVLG